MGAVRVGVASYLCQSFQLRSSLGTSSTYVGPGSYFGDLYKEISIDAY